MKFPNRIPTLLGIILVVLIVGGIGFAFEQITKSRTTASGSIMPLNVEISNVSDAAFTLSWLTEEAATGVVGVESPTAKQTIFDERDTAGKLGTYVTHSVTMRTAQPNTEYEAKILSNGKTYLANGEPYRIRTGPALSGQTSSLEPAFGMVLAESSTPADGSLVYLTPVGGQTLSTLVKSSGSWLIPLTLARTSDLASYLPSAERIDEDILVRFGTTETIATTDTLNDNPVPDMVLGRTYDFRRQQAKTTPAAGQLAAASLPAVLGQSTKITAFAVTSPAQNAALTTDLPLIQGTGAPGKTVSITLGITNPIGGSAVVGADGIWRYTPTQRLAAGRQSVTATSTGVNGETLATTHVFEILKSGTQVLGEATPSATPVATLAGEPVPTSGSGLPTIILTLLGVALFTTGGVLMAARRPATYG